MVCQRTFAEMSFQMYSVFKKGNIITMLHVLILIPGYGQSNTTLASAEAVLPPGELCVYIQPLKSIIIFYFAVVEKRWYFVPTIQPERSSGQEHSILS